MNRRLFLLAGALYLLFSTGTDLLVQRQIDSAVGSALRSARHAAMLDHRLALQPPMGYDDWNAVGCGVDEALIERTARAMVRSGLAAAGYRYVNIDDCWSATSRNRDGRLRADPIRFPHGIRWLARYVHSLGLKLGIYADAGTATCEGYPGSFGHEREDARTFAAWGVDYLKLDWCNVPYRAFPLYTHDQVGELLASRMALALQAARRPIVLSLSNGSDPTVHLWQWGRRVADAWRTTGDIVDTWDGILANLDGNTDRASGEGPGYWNDPDMLEVGNGGLSPTEERAHFSLWSVMAAPLIVGTDVTDMSRVTQTILTSRAVIAVDQDPLGARGIVIRRDANREVLMKPLANGDRAIVVLNRGKPEARIGVSATALGLTPSAQHIARDLWSGRVRTFTRAITVMVQPDSAVMLRIH